MAMLAKRTRHCREALSPRALINRRDEGSDGLRRRNRDWYAGFAWANGCGPTARAAVHHTARHNDMLFDFHLDLHIDVNLD